jgi:hypothetical protein
LRRRAQSSPAKTTGSDRGERGQIVTESADIRAAMKLVQDLEAIKRLKYKCMRCVDTKQWEELAECFTEDATTSHEGGRYSLAGRDAILEFFRRMNVSDLITMHHVHHPEIEIMAGEAAKGTWALEDYVIDLKANWSLRGAAFYEDEYVRVGGQWKIKHTGFQRVFWERWNRGETRSLKLIENMHGLPKADRSVSPRRNRSATSG